MHGCGHMQHPKSIRWRFSSRVIRLSVKFVVTLAGDEEASKSQAITAFIGSRNRRKAGAILHLTRRKWFDAI